MDARLTAMLYYEFGGQKFRFFNRHMTMFRDPVDKNQLPKRQTYTREILYGPGSEMTPGEREDKYASACAINLA